MRILRLFIDYNLDELVHWVLIEDDIETSNGASTFAEISAMTNITLEVYLGSTCCSIFNADVTGIPTKKLTDELLLGILEDQIIDDIDEVIPITIKTVDNIAIIAVFDKVFYNKLFGAIHQVGHPIRFIQSFVFATAYEDDAWTIFLTTEQRFVRINEYEYYSLDDTLPLPELLSSLYKVNPPTKLLIYNDQTYQNSIEQFCKQHQVQSMQVMQDYNYGAIVWNFDVPKSNSWSIKLNPMTVKHLWSSGNILKYVIVFVILFWLLEIGTLMFSNHKLNSQIKTYLSGISNIDNPTLTDLQSVKDKIISLNHTRGVYATTDAIPLFNRLLNIIPEITDKNIQQISYQNNTLVVILTDHSNIIQRQFANYRNIMATHNIALSMTNYKAYQATLPKTNNNLLQQASTLVIDNNSLVLILQPTTWYEIITGKHHEYK